MHAFVVDAAPTDTLLRTLELRDITAVDAVMISHADHDHVGDLTSLLSAPDVAVHRVYLNPDPTKQLSSSRRRLLLAALTDAHRAGRTKVETYIHDGVGTSLSAGDVVVEVLAPPIDAALGGVGSTTQGGKSVTSNTLSALVRFAARDGWRCCSPATCTRPGSTLCSKLRST